MILAKKMDAKAYFSLIIAIIFITNLIILLNIPFLRQISGFFFLTILPGLLLLQILKLKIDSLEKFILTVGLSISFLMFFGLLINNSSLSLGYERPLATIPLLISFNIAFITLAIVGYKINKERIFSLPNLNLTTSEKAFLAVPILFPALSIFGMHVMNTTDNNVILMFLLLLIPAYIVFVCLFNHKFSKRLYPTVIFLIGVSLLLILMLRFPHIYGDDVHIEYYYFQATLDNLHWNIVGQYALDACLSISLLPSIFQSFMNVNAQEYFFKGIYVWICSFGPVAIYVISKKYVDELYAFLASFFFMSQSTFLAVTASPRTNVAIFFIALTLMVFFNDKIEPLKRRILFIVFLLSVVVSHYSTTYIFFFVMLFSWLIVEIYSRRFVFKKGITLTTVTLFFAFIFFWYSQVTETAFYAGVGFIEKTFINLNDFFIQEMRTGGIKQLAGQELAYPILSRANVVFTWGTFILIGIGVLTMVKRYKEMISISNVKHKKADFLKTKFEMEYFVMALTCAGLLVAVLVVPYISVGYEVQRVYSIMIIVLSVCFVIGGMTLSKHFFFFTKYFLSKERTCAKKECNSFGKAFLSKKRFVLKEKQKSLTKNGSQVQAYLIILLILIPYSMFVTGVMYQIFGAPVAITLSSEPEAYGLKYIRDSESCGAKWLGMNSQKNTRFRPFSIIDGFGRKMLISQGKISSVEIDSYDFSAPRGEIKGYIYLCYINVVKNEIIVEGVTHNMSEYLDKFIRKNKVYSSGSSEIYW